MSCLNLPLVVQGRALIGERATYSLSLHASNVILMQNSRGSDNRHLQYYVTYFIRQISPFDVKTEVRVRSGQNSSTKIIYIVLQTSVRLF